MSGLQAQDQRIVARRFGPSSPVRTSEAGSTWELLDLVQFDANTFEGN